jgi:Holliday junction resolvase YEN1
LSLCGNFADFHPLTQALGEAEVELSAMNAAGLINAVVTNDVDTFLFGGLTVMRT